MKIENLVSTVTPIEQKYAFTSLEDCKAKLTQIQREENVQGLHCTGG